MGKSGQPHTRADRGGQRSKAASGEAHGGAERGAPASAQPDTTDLRRPPIAPEQTSGANASPVPGKDERRNRSI